MDKIAVVTGGHNGIGLAITRALVDCDMRVFIGARSANEPSAIEQLQKEFSNNVVLLPLDVRSSKSVAEFSAAVKVTTENIHILINCAGVTAHQLVSEHSDEQWNDVIDTNLTGPFKMIREFLPEMKLQGWGRIINIASTAATSAVADHAAYCASKSGLLGLSRAVALEGAPHGITCVTVSPTWVETDMLRNSAETMAAQQQQSVKTIMDDLRASNPQQRLVQPKEIGGLIAFLCSDNACGLTMEDIQVNAGAVW